MQLRNIHVLVLAIIVFMPLASALTTIDDLGIITTGNGTFDWTKAQYNWTIGLGSDYLAFDGSTLDFNKTELNSKYLNLSGTNANQDINIFPYNLTMGNLLSMGTDGSLTYREVGNTFLFNHGVYIGGTNGFLDVDTRLLVGEYADIDEYLLVGEYINISGDLNVWGNSSFDGNLIPMTTLTHNIGSGANRWNYLYVTNISADYADITRDLTVLGNITGDYFHGSGAYLTDLNVSGNVSVGGDLDMSGYSLTTSYLSGIVGTIDMRGDPWYLSGTDFQIAENLLVDKNISASWFKGKFNWTSADDWNIFDGSTLNFNESKLATIYYNATQSTIITGTIDGGTLADTQHQDGDYDGVTFNFSEVAGSPGLDLRMNFTGIDDFNQGIMRYKTNNLIGDYPIIQMWDYDDVEWEDYPLVGESENFATIAQPVFDSSDHLQGGVAQMRIYKASNGNTNNHYYVDWISISKGYGTPSGEEIDPDFNAWLNNPIFTSNVTATGFNITANWIFGNLNWSYLQNIPSYVKDWSFKLNATDQRFNETDLILSVNTTSNIESLGFVQGAHTVDTNASTACANDEVLLGNSSCISSSSFGGGTNYYPTTINTTTTTHTGNLTNGSLHGYKGANSICNLTFAGSHLCTEFEIIDYIANKDFSALSGDAWCNAGGPKYVPASIPVNDCNGWRHGVAGNYLGNYWHFDSTNGGDSRAINCGTLINLACCTY